MDPDADAPPASPARWAALPPDVLRLCLLKCGELAHAGSTLEPRQAAQLLQSMSPCRAWRAAALAEVPFKLQLASPEQAQHPLAAWLLSRVQCRELQLPAGDEVRVFWGQTEAAGEADAPDRLELPGTAVQLLSSPAVQAQLSGSLSGLANLPVGALVASPALLGAFSRLEDLDLCSNCQRPGGWVDLFAQLPSNAFPSSLRCLGASAFRLTTLQWLPEHLLVITGLLAYDYVLLGRQDAAGRRLAIMLTCLRSVVADVDALASLNCPSLTALATLDPSGGVCIQTRATDAAWLRQQTEAGELTDATAVLLAWLRVLRPAFAAHGGSLTDFTIIAYSAMLSYDLRRLGDPENPDVEFTSCAELSCPLPGMPSASQSIVVSQAGLKATLALAPLGRAGLIRLDIKQG